ncbi:variable surface protein [Plasmodium gonderi]|uniref:Variable surface protein n=1 Tax=Plasmodium gonderi TaxID=77519 RepID=A0A1Y1JP93_PLAGO|nr:variable surface protein [Plasmodium gonderi]GAW84060.1 variable surface protein [Plasmodium gonderi]
MYIYFCNYESKYENILPNLPSYKKYKELDNVDISNYNQKYCNDLERSNEEDKTLCTKIAKNLSILKSEINREKKKHGCHYFQHWFHNKISKKYYNINDKVNNNFVAGKLFNFVSIVSLSNLEEPDCNGYTYGYPKLWKEEKDLHDYFENYGNINSLDLDKETCEKHIRYVTYIKEIYEQKIHNCCEDEDLGNLCTSYMKCDDKYKPNDLMEKLNKKLEELSEQDEEVPEEEAAVGYKLSLSFPSSESTNHNKNKVSAYSSEFRDIQEPVVIYDTHRNTETVYNKLDFNSFGNIFIAVSVLGTFLFLFYYYRSTRLGSSSQKNKRKKEKLKNNYYNELEDDDLPAYNSKVTYLNSEISRYCISHTKL